MLEYLESLLSSSWFIIHWRFDVLQDQNADLLTSSDNVLVPGLNLCNKCFWLLKVSSFTSPIRSWYVHFIGISVNIVAISKILLWSLALIFYSMYALPNGIIKWFKHSCFKMLSAISLKSNYINDDILVSFRFLMNNSSEIYLAFFQP